MEIFTKRINIWPSWSFTFNNPRNFEQIVRDVKLTGPLRHEPLAKYRWNVFTHSNVTHLRSIIINLIIYEILLARLLSYILKYRQVTE